MLYIYTPVLIYDDGDDGDDDEYTNLCNLCFLLLSIHIFLTFHHLPVNQNYSRYSDQFNASCALQGQIYDVFTLTRTTIYPHNPDLAKKIIRFANACHFMTFSCLSPTYGMCFILWRLFYSDDDDVVVVVDDDGELTHYPFPPLSIHILYTLTTLPYHLLLRQY